MKQCQFCNLFNCICDPVFLPEPFISKTIGVEHTALVDDKMRENFVTKDSGERRSFSTGAVRDVNNNKGRYDLISPIVIDRLAKLMQRGADKYKARNWEQGMELSVYFDSGLRHAFKHLEGHRDEDHLAAVLFNFGALIHIDEMIKRGLLPKELDDLPNYLKKED